MAHPKKETGNKAGRPMSALNAMPNNNSYNFTLTLEGIHEPSEELENALFEAGCDDGMLFFRDQTGYMEFDRSSDSIESAIVSAINNVESSGAGVRIARVEPSDLVTGAEISRRLNRSRESIRLLIKGARGSGDFPTPLAGVTTKTLIWSWAEVTKWFSANEKIDNPFIVKQAQVIRELNEALEVRKNPFTSKRISFFISKLGKAPEQIQKPERER